MADRRHLPNRRRGHSFTVGDGAHQVHVTTGEYRDGTLGEIFLDCAKEGSFSRGVLNAFAMVVSLGLQHGVPLEAFHHTFRDFKMDPDLIREIFTTLEELYGVNNAKA